MDHSDGSSEDAYHLPLLAMGMGISVIEKHMTLDHSLEIEDYVSETDMLIGLTEQGKAIGIEPLEGTRYSYYKTKSGYTIQEMVKDKSDFRKRF